MDVECDVKFDAVCLVGLAVTSKASFTLHTIHRKNSAVRCLLVVDHILSVFGLK